MMSFFYFFGVTVTY